MTNYVIIEYMDKIILNNTFRKTTARVLLYKDKKEYVGVCLDFDIVVRGKTTRKVWSCIKELVEIYLENAVKNKLPVDVLNRPAPKQYWGKYLKFLEYEKAKIESKNKTPGVSRKPSSPSVTVFNQQYQNGRAFAF